MPRLPDPRPPKITIPGCAWLLLSYSDGFITARGRLYHKQSARLSCMSWNVPLWAVDGCCSCFPQSWLRSRYRDTEANRRDRGEEGIAHQPLRSVRYWFRSVVIIHALQYTRNYVHSVADITSMVHYAQCTASAAFCNPTSTSGIESALNQIQTPRHKRCHSKLSQIIVL